MTNDTSTLNGALQELGETMAANLVAQGVTGASASDGLTTLAGKILDIQTGSSCYHIEFNEASYIASGGSATLELTLQQNYAPVSGATVTVTGSDSSLYTCLTDSDGVGTVTVTGVTAETTFTASYSNVSDSCTVTVSSVIYSDDCTTDKSSNYSGGITFRNSSNLISLSYDSTNQRYTLTENHATAHNLHIIPLDNYVNIKIEYDFQFGNSNTGYYYGLIMYKDSNDNITFNLSTNEFFKGQTVNGSYTETKTKSVSSMTGKWLHYEITIQSKVMTVKLYKDDSLYHTETWNISDTIWDNAHYGFAGWGKSSGTTAYVKNINVEAL